MDVDQIPATALGQAVRVSLGQEGNEDDDTIVKRAEAFKKFLTSE